MILNLLACLAVAVSLKTLDNYAAELIEKSNLKGFCIGGACVSEKHANFIINYNKASAADIENLVIHIQQTVRSNFKIDLETELKII